MDSIEIKEVKKFMGELLIKETFDEFLFQQAFITTYNTFQLDGHIQKDFYSQEEYEALGSPKLSTWKQIKPICYEMIKGKRTPLKFKIVLCLSGKETEKLLSELETTLTMRDITGLYLNIIYENQKLHCVTGTGLELFTMDKSLEKAWDKKMMSALT